MKKIISLSLIIWSFLFWFDKSAMCAEKNNTEKQETIIVDNDNKEIIRIYSINEILGLQVFDAPEEFVYDPMPGAVFATPVEVLITQKEQSL